jgi:hypothetical protein
MKDLVKEWINKAEEDFHISVAFRYPGELATRNQARESVRAIKQLRPILRRILNLG